MINKLRTDAEADSAALVVENSELKSFIESLRLELTLAEVKRTRQEEELKLAVRKWHYSGDLDKFYAWRMVHTV